MTRTKKPHFTPEKPFTQIPDWLLNDSELSHREYRLMIQVYMQTAGFNRRSYTGGFQTLSDNTGIPVRHIGGILDRIKAKGYITKSFKSNKDYRRWKPFKRGTGWEIKLSSMLFKTEELPDGDYPQKVYQSEQGSADYPKKCSLTIPKSAPNTPQKVYQSPVRPKESIKEINKEGFSFSLNSKEGSGKPSQMELDLNLKTVWEKYPNQHRRGDYNEVFRAAARKPEAEREKGLYILKAMVPIWEADGGKFAPNLVNYWDGEYYNKNSQCVETWEDMLKEAARIQADQQQRQEWQQAKGCPQFERFQMLLEGNEENYQEGIISEDKYLQIKAGYERRLNQFAQA